MEPMSKDSKSSGETVTRLLVDRISDLPPELIGSLLSFLPTKEAVATSVLSTKWKWYWTFITSIKFDVPLSLYPRGDGDRVELLKANFISFAYRVLLYRKPSLLNYFGVSCCQTYFGPHIRAWISAGLLFGVKELDLSVHLSDASHVLPADMFSCKSLVKLKLGRRFKIDAPPVVCLPSLQVLVLTQVWFSDDDSFRRLLVGCPILEEFVGDNYNYISNPRVLPLELLSCGKLARLELYYGFVLDVPTLVSLPSLHSLHLCKVKILDDDSLRRFFFGCPSLQELKLTTYGGVNVLHVDAPRLSDLTITFQAPNHLSESGDGLHSKIVLDTPSLQYLEFDLIELESLEVTDLSQLVEAKIYADMGTHYQVASKLIMAISKVQTLYLCDHIIEVILKHGCNIPKFHNMTNLKFGDSRDGWALLPDLLENSPVLQSLVLCGHEGLLSSMGPTPTWHAPQNVPYCLTHHLKVIQVNYFEGDIEEEEMMRYFIENRGTLKDLTIQCSPGSGNLLNVVAA